MSDAVTTACSCCLCCALCPPNFLAASESSNQSSHYLVGPYAIS